ncbi:hypothetical protein MPSI1_002547 [Malassezia psittaci]|uniref:Uncharacterized protein n=1 Tax=Malassezia psittaci TaxID=1821823 RepID=A0AAF0FFZ8_9BASI|nr:hypothetical protein MPSI1_002547 [Malassezia psittaci]
MQSARKNLSREDVTVDDAERRKTLEILWRLETGEGVISDDETDTEIDENAEQPSDRETEQLLKSLSVNDRQRFQSLLKDPSKAARMYFEEEQEVLPWWKKQDPSVSSIQIAQEIQDLADSQLRVRIDLRYNIVAVLLAYTYTLRHLEIPSCSSIDHSLDEGQTDSRDTTKDEALQIHSSESSSRRSLEEAHADASTEADSDGEPPPLEDDHEISESCLPEAHRDSKSIIPEVSPNLYPQRSPSSAEQRMCSPLGSASVRGHPSRSPAQEEMRQVGIDLLHRLIPIVFAHPRKNAAVANIVLTSVTDATLHFLQAVNPYELGTSVSELLVTLLKDIRPLLAPEGVRMLDQVSLMNLALSDLYAWVRWDDRNAGKKLVYYAYAYDAITSQSRKSLCDELDAEIDRLENERDEQQRLAELSAANAAVSRMDTSVQRMASQPKIQLLE